MTRRGLALWWYRFRITLADRRGGYLALALLIALIGGVGLASLAAARRTQSSYPTFVASTNPSDLTVSIYGANGGPVAPLTAQIGRLPEVRRVRTEVAPHVLPLTAAGEPDLRALNYVVGIGSLDGLTTTQDRLTAVQGRLADPNRPDEVTLTQSGARLLGARLGGRLALGIYGQQGFADIGNPGARPTRIVRARVVGIVVLNNALIEDDIDNAYGFYFLTPALLHEAVAISPSNADPITYGVQLRHRAGDAAAERAIAALVPKGAVYEFHLLSRTLGQAELALKPESVALGGFGFIALVVCLVLGAQALSRQYRMGDQDRQVLRSLGAGPVSAAGDGLGGIAMSVVAGALGAVAVAVALSPLAPLGPVRSVYPDGGVSFDGTVLAGGFCLLVVVLLLHAVREAYRGAPHRGQRRSPRWMGASRVIGRVEAAGLPVSGVVGARFAFEPGSGRTTVPVRSAMLGAALAVVTVVATLTFTSSLSTLVGSPPLYGWNWSYALNPSNSVPPRVLPRLAHDPDVAAWTGYQYENATIDGQTVPFLASNVDPAVGPPILHGHGLEANDQIVLGAATMAALHTSIGGTVTLSFGDPGRAPLYVPPASLRVVGTATFPAVGYSSFVADHTSMGTGAWFSLRALGTSFVQALDGPDSNLQGPAIVFVRLRSGVSARAGLANLHAIATDADRVLNSDPNTAGDGVSVIGVQRPAQIVNYRTIGSTPLLLAVGLAAGAVVALGFTLFTSVRRRRRDLALLKALGFTPGQLAAAVSWQSSVAALVGVIVGVPLGIAAGRLLWDAFANNLNAVPDPTVPALSVVLVVAGALLFANLVAALPGRSAARTSTAELLRSD